MLQQLPAGEAAKGLPIDDRIQPELLSDEQARAMFNVGARTWAEMVATATWLPAPIALGPRLRRWNRQELIDAIRNRAPRGTRGDEPAQLRRARIERLKAGGAQ